MPSLWTKALISSIHFLMFWYGPSNTLQRKVPERVAMCASGMSLVTSMYTSEPHRESSSERTIMLSGFAPAASIRHTLRFMTAPKFSGI